MTGFEHIFFDQEMMILRFFKNFYKISSFWLICHRLAKFTKILNVFHRASNFNEISPILLTFYFLSSLIILEAQYKHNRPPILELNLKKYLLVHIWILRPRKHAF